MLKFLHIAGCAAVPNRRGPALAALLAAIAGGAVAGDAPGACTDGFGPVLTPAEIAARDDRRLLED